MVRCFFPSSLVLLPTTLDTGLHSKAGSRLFPSEASKRLLPTWTAWKHKHEVWGRRRGMFHHFFPPSYILVDGSESNRAGRREIKMLQMGNEGVERKLKQQKRRGKEKRLKGWREGLRNKGRKQGEMKKCSRRRKQKNKGGSSENIEEEGGAETSLGLCFRFYKL